MNLFSPNSALGPVTSPASSPVVFAGMMGQVFVPVLIERAGVHARRRWTEFFAASIVNANTSLAYGRAISRFLAWCDGHGVALEQIDTTTVGAYIKSLPGASATARQALAAIRVFFNWMVTGGVLPANPAAAVRAPKEVIRRGKTPVLFGEDARRLLGAIDVNCLVGLRDRALIATMIYTFARVSAVVGLTVADHYQVGRRSWLRLKEKGGRFHEVPLHHKAEEFLDAYLAAAGIGAERNTPLFRSAEGKSGRLTSRGLNRTDALVAIKRRAAAVGLPPTICCHTFRATGITNYLENGGLLEKAQQMAAHASPQTTRLYDRTSEALSLDEFEKIHL